MSERSRAVAAHIARAIMRNSKKRWAGLRADALEEQMNFSEEIHATGAPTNGAPATRGESQKEATGKNQNADMAVTSQVENVTAHRVDQKDVSA
jgi:hypothetical protein